MVHRRLADDCSSEQTSLLLPWPHVPRPVCWERVFGRAAPLQVEIGFGNGEYLARTAEASRELDLVGIETDWGSVRRALKRLRRAPLPNVRLLLADARIVLQRAFTPRAIARVEALFPCPWPKARHEKHRLFSTPFLRLLNSRLADGATARIVTDDRPYLDWILAQAQAPDTGFAPAWNKIPARFDTKYERKWLGQGKDVFYELRLVKIRHAPIPHQEDVTVEMRRCASFAPESFVPRGVRGDVTVEFKEFLYDPRRACGMVRTVVVEDGLTQHLWITIARDQRQWVIRPAQGCGFLPTPGVQRAIDVLHEQINNAPT